MPLSKWRRGRLPLTLNKSPNNWSLPLTETARREGTDHETPLNSGVTGMLPFAMELASKSDGVENFRKKGSVDCSP